jgi:hypothetical protein
MSREDFKLKALEYAMDLLKSNKDEQHSQELDYVLNILKEREEEIRMAKEEGLSVA